MTRHLLILAILLATSGTSRSQSNVLGMASALENDSLLYATGFRLIGTNVEKLLSPGSADSVLVANKEIVRRLKCKIIMCNVLFPGRIKIAGPDVKEAEVLAYLEDVLKRAQLLGVPNLILGSGGARRLPDDYDKVKAKADFIVLAQKMARLAKKYDVTIMLENLNSTETNFLTRLRDAADVVRKVAHPGFRLNADIYHMLKEDESPDEIRNAKGLISYCEIAEENGRTLPGVEKENFVPYLAALQDIGYKGPIIIEGRSKSLEEDVPRAYTYLRSQLDEAARDRR